MAGAKEIMGSLMVEKSSLLPSSFILQHNLQHNKLCFSPSLIPQQQKRKLNSRKVLRTPMAAISENLVRAVQEKPVQFKVRAVVIVKKKNKEDLKETIVNHFDALTEIIGRNVVLELLSTEIDPKTKAPKKSNQAVLRDWSKKSKIKAERVTYTVDFIVDSNFGIPGAITVTNKHQKEFFLESITIEGFACGAVHFTCNSWVQSQKDHPEKRIFFSNMLM
ncbi:Lipoxygenase [Macleaya cordata]|uniref:Lipoxygenase n=1 Tax=Macleaya cordata TaxID=56857 RepID=A0A200Q003_MACCD|nr:Lipoxygenase [Macleaya cordata]